MRRLYPLCARLAASGVPVVIEGETGTGKEVLAEALHQASPRAAAPFGIVLALALAGALMHDPRVIILDEPLTGLDPLGIRRMKDSIVRRARDGAAIVLSSHLLHLLEEVCTHVLILKKGDKVAVGTLAEVSTQFSNGEPNVSLEEIFIRATGGSET